MAARTWRERLRDARERHAVKLDVLFFAAGFTFDVFAARAGVDHTLMIVQQVFYLGLIGFILYVDFARSAQADAVVLPHWLERIWKYRSYAFHFCLGTLMNLYSIFFLMSASVFSSIVFVMLLFTAIILNELHAVRRGLDVKVALYVVCVFCFWSLMIPILMHHISRLTVMLSFAATLTVLTGFSYALIRQVGFRVILRRLVAPGLAVSVLFLALHQAGLVPPVPIAAKKLGVYHRVERAGDRYHLFREPAGWRFWRKDDRVFRAEPGDALNVFFAIYAPTNFDDTVFVRWSVKTPQGWQDSDRIPIRIVGGRDDGFRGFATKQNYVAGDWRVLVETREGWEITRLHFTVWATEVNPARVLEMETY